jgi:hypothetical protein
VKFTHVTLLLALASVSSAASAEQYVNGWTEVTFKSAVRGCIDSALPRQLQFMSSSGQIKPGASPEQLASARSMAVNYVTDSCTCALRQVMQSTRIEEIQSIKQRPDYARQITTACSTEVLRNRR